MSAIAKGTGALVPPFPRTFIEFAHLPTEPAGELLTPVNVGTEKQCKFVNALVTGVYLKTEQLEHGGWEVTANEMSLLSDGDFIAGAIQYTYSIDENGVLADKDPDIGSLYQDQLLHFMDQIQDKEEQMRYFDQVRYNALESGYIALTACGFINCKNIGLELEPERHTTKAKRRKYGDPVRYYHIKLPLAPGRRSDGRRNVDDGGAVPIHIVRGHFKTYTDENPLFGKVTGTWWWGHHARGDEKNGVSIHDYEVAPAE